MITVLVGPDEAGMRFDRLLRKRLPLRSLSEIYGLIRKGRAKVNGKRAKENSRLVDGDIVLLPVDEVELQNDKGIESARLTQLVNTPFFRKNFKIIHEDEHMLVCNKPAGLVVHSGTGHSAGDSLIELAMAYLAKESEENPRLDPQLVHRLDRDTSGVILIAKDKATLRELHGALRERRVEKVYEAVCHGCPKPPSGEINLVLEKNYARNDGTKMHVSDRGLKSRSTYRTEANVGNLSRVKVQLHTGRTHQIRVHMAHIQCPIVGDVRYGNAELNTQIFQSKSVRPRLFLHAKRIVFFHSKLNKNVSFEAPVPPVFEELLKHGQG